MRKTSHSTDLLSLLLRLVDYGLMDFRMTGARQLSAWKPNTAALRDLTTGDSPVILRGGRDITAAPDVGTREDMASAAYVVGDDDVRQEVAGVAPPLPWGRWEVGLRRPGITDTNAAHAVGTIAVTRGAVERVQRTREISMYQARWLPLRIRQITVKYAPFEMLSPKLNDRFEVHDLRVARTMRALAALQSGPPARWTALRA